MKTTLYFSVSIDGFIANKDGIPLFPEGAWEEWCSYVNNIGNVIAGRTSVEQLQIENMGAALHPEHKIVLSSHDIDFSGSGWKHARSASEALEILNQAGVTEAIIGGGRAVYHAFMKEKLVDDILIDLQPVAFGEGIPVFGDVLDLAQLKLLESNPLNEDVIRLRYQVLNAG